MNAETMHEDILHEEEEFNYEHKIKIRKLDNGAPMRWLSKGIEDFRVNPMLSMTYGLVFAVLGMILIYFTYQKPLYTFGLVTIFYLAGPIISVGLYCMSRHIEAGVKPEFGQGCKAMCYNPIGVVSFSIVIGMLIVLWTMVTGALFAVYFGGMTITEGGLMETLIANKQVVPFVGMLAIVGILFSIVSFSLSVISIPLMTHRKSDVVTAIVTSVRAVKKNPVVMLTWAFAIVALMALGFAAAFIGIAVALPIIGHASWHAYREVVEDDRVMTVEECDLPTFPFRKKKIKI